MRRHNPEGPDWDGVLVVSEFPPGAWARFRVGLALALLPVALIHYFYGFRDAEAMWRVILLGVTWTLGGLTGVVLGTLFAAAPSVWGPLRVCAQVLVIGGGFVFGTLATAYYLDGTNLAEQLSLGPRPIRHPPNQVHAGELYRHVAGIISGAGGLAGLGVGVAGVWLVKRALRFRPLPGGSDAGGFGSGEGDSWDSVP
jgi:hypothetical protein